MAVFQSTMMSFLLLNLAGSPFFGSSQHIFIKNCSSETYTAECGNQVVLLCTPPFLVGKQPNYLRVRQQIDPNGTNCVMEGVGKHISPNGRLQCFIAERKAGLQLKASKITDTGSYEFDIHTDDSNHRYKAYLKITGTKKMPDISLTLDNKTIVCKVYGGCPVGQIEWFDNFQTNWTKNAIVKDEDGLIVSTLHLSPFSTMKEYYCKVSYQLMGNTESKTSCISMESLTGCNGPESVISDPKDPENSAVPILVPIALATCAIIMLVIWQRRRIFPGQRQARVPIGVNEPEMQGLREEN